MTKAVFISPKGKFYSTYENEFINVYLTKAIDPKKIKVSKDGNIYIVADLVKVVSKKSGREYLTDHINEKSETMTAIEEG